MKYTVNTLMKTFGTFNDLTKAKEHAEKIFNSGYNYVEIRQVSHDKQGNYYSESINIYRK